MTTSPVVSVTDELIADLEKEARLCDSDTSIFMDPAVVVALLAERAELKRDAERLEFVLDRGDSCQWLNIIKVDPDDFDSLREAIDAAMES